MIIADTIQMLVGRCGAGGGGMSAPPRDDYGQSPAPAGGGGGGGDEEDFDNDIPFWNSCAVAPPGETGAGLVVTRASAFWLQGEIECLSVNPATHVRVPASATG